MRDHPSLVGWRCVGLQRTYPPTYPHPLPTHRFGGAPSQNCCCPLVEPGATQCGPALALCILYVCACVRALMCGFEGPEVWLQMEGYRGRCPRRCYYHHHPAGSRPVNPRVPTVSSGIGKGQGVDELVIVVVKGVNTGDPNPLKSPGYRRRWEEIYHLSWYRYLRLHQLDYRYLRLHQLDSKAVADRTDKDTGCVQVKTKSHALCHMLPTRPPRPTFGLIMRLPVPGFKLPSGC